MSEKHKTTAFCVERDIRTTIEITVNRGDIEYLYSIFGNTICKDKGKRVHHGGCRIIKSDKSIGKGL